MKKILVTENQLKSLMSSVVKEQVPATRALEYSMNDGRYQVTCKFNIHWGYNDLFRYKNGEIDDFDYGSGIISYLLEIDHQPYGIQGIYVKDLKYPPAIEVPISYYPEGVSSEDDDSLSRRIEEKIKILIDWKGAQISTWNDSQITYFGVVPNIDVKIKPDGKGGFIGTVEDIGVRQFEPEKEE